MRGFLPLSPLLSVGGTRRLGGTYEIVMAGGSSSRVGGISFVLDHGDGKDMLERARGVARRFHGRYHLPAARPKTLPPKAIPDEVDRQGPFMGPSGTAPPRARIGSSPPHSSRSWTARRFAACRCSGSPPAPGTIMTSRISKRCPTNSAGKQSALSPARSSARFDAGEQGIRKFSVARPRRAAHPCPPLAL